MASSSSQKKRRKIPRAKKISINQRGQFLKAVFQDGIKIREAAKVLKINYSTAKAIAKMHKLSPGFRRLKRIRDMTPIKKTPIVNETCPDRVPCTYTIIEGKTQNIKIVSTVGWNFAKDGLPNDKS